MANVLIVGGGAAGLMAAGAAVRQGHKVTVLEHMDKPGQKILVTGKGRCNVTNDCTAEEFLHHVRTNPRFLFSSLGAFPRRGDRAGRAGRSPLFDQAVGVKIGRASCRERV